MSGGAERLWNIVSGLAATFTQPGSSVYYGYLLSALLIASAVYWLRDGRAGPASLSSYLCYLFPAHAYWARSTRHDFGIFVLNALLYSFVLMGPVTAASMATATSTWGVMIQGFGDASAHTPGLSEKAVLTLAVLLAADLGFFLSHYAQHRIPLLWEFHKVHHSAPSLTPLTVFRRHPVDVVIERGLSGVLVGVVLGVFAYQSGGRVDVLEVMGVNLGMFVFLTAGFNLQHSHIWLSYGPLDRLFISPAAHQIHHSRALVHRDKNFGNVFAFWDRIFGTQLLPGKRQQLELGIDGVEDREYQSLWALYLLPLKKFVLRCLGRRAARPELPVAAVPPPS